MKKTFTKLFLLLALPFAANAQITVTSADFPALNDVWYEYHDTINAFGIGAGSGISQNWDFSNFTVSRSKISNFELPSVTPATWAAAFPNAQMVNYNPSDSTADFFVSNTNGFYFDGSIDSTSANSQTFDFNPEYTYLPTPFTLNSTRLSTGKVTVVIAGPGYNYKLILYIHQSFLADAFGTVTTPSGVYNNTLRIKTMSYKEDTALIDVGAGYQFLSSTPPNDTTIDYNWWVNGVNSLVLSVQERMNGTAGTGTSKEATFYSASPSPLAVDVKKSETDVNIYPNPAGRSQYVNFSVNNDNARNVTIINSNGQVVRTTQISGKTKFSFDTEIFASGIYMYNITDAQGTSVKTGKFSVVK